MTIESKPKPRAAMLWTGGKDSAMALHDAVTRFRVECLVTFVPDADPDFHAHSLLLMQAQSEALDIPHEQMTIREPYREGYISAIRQLKQCGIEVLVTGDIAPVDGYPNWISECALGLVETWMPLWDIDRVDAIQRLVNEDYDVRISMVALRHLTKDFVGRRFDASLIDALTALPEIDPCGENGEFHSCVLDAPLFKYPLKLSNATVVQTSDYAYLHVPAVESAPRN